MTTLKTRLVYFAVALLLCSCAKFSSKQKEAISAALDSLGKLKAATQVGVNYQQYGTLLIEAKAKVNSAAEVLPNGDLKNSLEGSIQAYADAHTYWGTKINRDFVVEEKIKNALVEKYKVPVESFGYLENQNEILSLVWNAADGLRQKASSVQ